MCTPLFYFFYFVFSVCVFFSVCVRLARQGTTEKSTQREDELYIESAPLAEILSKCANFARRIPKNLHRLVNSPRDFPPNSYTILKRLFAITMRPPPKQSVQICQLFHVTFPKRLLQFFVSSMTSGHLCAILAG